LIVSLQSDVGSMLDEGLAIVNKHQDQCRINNSSKCSNCYGPRAFGGPAVFC